MTFFLLLAHVGGIEHQKVQLCTRCLKADAWLIVFYLCVYITLFPVLPFCALYNGTYKVSASKPAPSDIQWRETL